MISSHINIFDRTCQRQHRARAAVLGPSTFLIDRAAEDLSDRLAAVLRRFDYVLDLGTPTDAARRALAASGKVGTVISADVSAGSPASRHLHASGGASQARLVVAADEEALPFHDGSFDLVVSALALQFVNDLPGALVQIRRALKPDGLMLAALAGGETLTELRQAFATAESEIEGGLSPRVAPFADLRDLGGLLQRAGFAMPVVDSDRLTVTYPDALALMRELRGMGESNTAVERRRSFSRRGTLLRAAVLYAEKFGQADGRIPASFEIVTLTAWAPHESQPRPLRPGSATRRLADALGSVEQPAGDTAKP